MRLSLGHYLKLFPQARGSELTSAKALYLLSTSPQNRLLLYLISLVVLCSIFLCNILDYLSLPKSPRRADYLPIIGKIDKRLSGWKCSTLSRGGCLILLNVLSSLPVYFCSAFALPIWLTRAIDRIRRGFFWKVKSSITGFHCLANWDHVCCSKRVRGIGINKLNITNSALLMKGLWKFHTSHTLPWVQLLKQKHYRRRPASTTSSIPYGWCPIWKKYAKTLHPILHLSWFYSRR